MNKIKIVNKPQLFDWRAFCEDGGVFDDLYYCLENNPPETPSSPSTNWSPDDVLAICAEVPGANDELNWWWILALKDGRYVLLSAWCDYTGWNCRSGIEYNIVTDSAEAAALAATEREDYSGRYVRANLLAQLRNRSPYGLYDASIHTCRSASA